MRSNDVIAAWLFFSVLAGVCALVSFSFLVYEIWAYRNPDNLQVGQAVIAVVDSNRPNASDAASRPSLPIPVRGHCVAIATPYPPPNDDAQVTGASYSKLCR